MTHQPFPRPRPSWRPRRSAARSPAAPLETAPADQLNPSADATPDPPPTAAVRPKEDPVPPSCHLPPHTSLITRCCDDQLNPPCDPLSLCTRQPATSGPRRATALARAVTARRAFIRSL